MPFQSRAHPLPRIEGSDQVMLATRMATGVLTNRNAEQVARYGQPVACDVATHLALYDVDALVAALLTVARRKRRRVA